MSEKGVYSSGKSAQGNVTTSSIDHHNAASEERGNEDAASVHSSQHSIQTGVQKAMILRKAWSRTTLAIAFTSLIITSLCIVFSDYSGTVLEPYVTSAFKQHSAMSAARVVMNITRIVAYPVIAKLSDVFGRAEMFSMSIACQALSFILYAASQNIDQYIGAGLFDAIGGTGFGLTQQVFIADATNLVNRAFWSTLPESITTIPALYIGTMIGEGILHHSSWRWGYGMWAIIVPVVAIPLVGTMTVLQRRAAKHGLKSTKTLSAIAGCEANDPLTKKIFHLLWDELDLPGMALLITSLSLILIPISLTGSFNSGRWKEGSFIAMIVVGFVLFVAFLVWDMKFARKPYIPTRMANRTVICACAIQLFDFMEYSSFTIFFPSYLQVGGGFSPGHATRIDNSLRVAFQISGLLFAIAMKYTNNSKAFVLAGPPLVILGQGLMIYFVRKPDGSHGSEAMFIVSKVLSGIGRAAFQTAGQVAVQAAVSRQEVAVATGLFQASNSIGGAFGVSMSGAIWRNTLPNKLKSYLPEKDKASALKIFQSIVVAQKYKPGTPSRDAINRSYGESQRLLAIVATCLCVPNLILMFFIKNADLKALDEKEKERLEREKMEVEDGADGGVRTAGN
ncbi:MFS general substrate transporter [Aaosphaeria arxii CBS 175.79]|uniref:MFS general substrate transporter n=1 Tax=Aaosphaeria arxii CBS 175.79 TaxID=1450172 RepID=A0A6A5XQS8_9PLEO|nr:MFS general substrate transporter [Aaosphaeria arxii CBS 175.79]KAF2015522.1 MFS general substrate transporter [Aaosphaeria arxii CBS 175.79]